MRTLEIREPRREKVELDNTTTTKSYRLGTVLLGIRRTRKPPKVTAPGTFQTTTLTEERREGQK